MSAMKSKLFAVALATAMIFSCFSPPGADAQQWSNPDSNAPATVGVRAIEVGADNRIYVLLDSNPFTTNVCTTTPPTHWRLGPATNTAGVDKMLSLLLAAKLSGTKVRIYRSGACDGPYPIISIVTLG